LAQGVQKLGGEANETDRSLLEGGASEQNSSHLLTTILKAVEKRMENPQKVLMHPQSASLLTSFVEL